MQPERHRLIRALFDEYIEMYAARDDRLTARFSDDFSGFTGGGDVLVKDKDEWIRITRQDFLEVPARIRIEPLDISMQDASDDVAVVTAFFRIHLPISDQILAKETARLVVVFRLEGADWKIVHSGISIPYNLVSAGEVYPLKGLRERNLELERLVEERTRALEETNNKLEALSYTDALTGIANRRSFDRVLEQECKRGQRAVTPVALIMLDVDHFKHFNDRYGHLAGDDCLQVIAGAIAQARRRAGELVARYGGEEFAVLLPNTSVGAAIEAAEHIQHAIRSLAIPHADTPPGIITVSLGVASLIFAPQGASEELVRRADAALYRAKQSGRNCLQSAPD